ncbi:Exodeoxyribonuclease 7 large subunit [Acholeplasma hippikon]|uniref:Exodeoxyribonuclease 7 large subunit n=2 Tax=Acholeplasma hippikon TaxID=264636 RepID=A0A449BI94_9MOLU|nr:Exodeoxyribonuclease 7 large subunit [Acholeplasma hippikon]
MQQQYLTVTALTTYLKVKLENDPHLKKILLKGEISNFKRHSSGHLYFSLKDEKAQISAMMFSTYTKNLSFEPKDGDKVLVEGYISLYEARGTYSLSIYSLTLDGIGELYMKYEKLKKDFEALGYFDQVHKKPIPKYPKAIGVITSPTGAVIQDIKTTVERRYLLTKIILYPALVQGEGSKEDLVKKIKRANLDNEVDVIILGRGGGSIEDLWSFNEPEVVMAIFESKIPIITAIGHETDTTLSDYVGDLRAPTPTAAAELTTPNVTDLLNEIKEKRRLLNYYMNEELKNLRQKLLHLDERLSISSPKSKIEQLTDKANQLTTNLHRNFSHKLNELTYIVTILSKRLLNPSEKLLNFKDRLNHLSIQMDQLYKNQIMKKTYELQRQTEKLKSVNPLAIMERGFGLVTKENKVLTSVKDIRVDDFIDIELKDGKVSTKVINKEVKSWAKN